MTAANVQRPPELRGPRHADLDRRLRHVPHDGTGPPGIFGAFPGSVNELETGTLGHRHTCNCRTIFKGDARYAYLQGTSMAAPKVAAVAALVRHLNPDLTATEIIRDPQADRPPPGRRRLDAGPGLGDPRRAAPRSPPRGRSTAGRRSRRSARARPAHAPHRSRCAGAAATTARPGVVASGVARFEIWRSVDGAPAAPAR